MNSEQRSQILRTGLLAGIAAWLVGYAATYVLVAPDVRDSPLHRFIEAFNEEAATYEMVGWVFYNAHFVNTIFRDVPIVGSQTTSFLGGEDGFSAALYLIPAGVLLATGLALARYHGVTNTTDGGFVGATVVPTYLLASIVGVYAFEVTVGSARGAPDLLPAIFLAGIVFPLIFAGGGGALGGGVGNRDESRRVAR